MARARTIWEEGVEPGRLVVALGVAVTLSLALLELAARRELGWLFDAGFIVLCVAMALRVRLRDSFQIGLVPPLLMLGVLLLLALAAPATIADEGDGTVQAVITGLADHAGALITGYALCLAVLAIRQHIRRKRRSERAPRRPE